MMRTNFKYKLGFWLLFFSSLISAQTVDRDRGCIGLEVQFSSDNLSSYFWDFKDGANSILQNPIHQYVTPGIYDVTLQEGENGPVIGTIQITIYEKPTVTINVSPTRGCIPLEVEFNANITIDSELILSNIIWTFGDGATGQGQTISHSYTQVNVFDIFVKLETEIPNCDQTLEFENQVRAETAESVFTVDNDAGCEVPAQLQFFNQSSQLQGTTYQWDFGNGMESTDFNPGNITYSNRGNYDVQLIVQSPAGCTDTSELSVIVGEPLIDVEIPDTLCVNEAFTIINNTSAESFDWRFGSPQVRSFRDQPTISYNMGGFFEIELRAVNGVNCFTDTTFQIFIEEPDVDFELDPESFCRDNIPYTFIATNPNHQYYLWGNNPDSLNTDPFFDVPGFSARDSLYINLPDSITGTLTAISTSGCVNTLTKSFNYELTEAYFVPDVTKGIRPLEVTFNDFSNSENDIVRRFWRHGDGTVLDLGPNDTIHTHTYTKCGINNVTLLVEDSEGCVDVSKTVEILVICLDTIPGNGGGSCIDPFCVDDNLEFDIPIFPGIGVLVDTEDQRIDHCWPSGQISENLNYPIETLFEIGIEFEGVFLGYYCRDSLIVEGTKAVITHSVQCSDPFTFNFLSNNSIDAETFTWMYNGEVISTDSGLTFTFDELGEHDVSLITNNSDGCPPDTITETVYVTIPVADFTIPDRMCDNISYDLDATASQDVFESCHKGYLWNFVDSRPRETQNKVLEHEFNRGRQEVKLIVEDINGCKDSTTRITTVYGIDPLTNLDSVTCLPYPKQLMDLSIADTSLVAWDWSFGSQEQNPFYDFDTSDLTSPTSDSLLVTLIVEDALGCIDSITQIVQIVEPNFFIASEPNSRSCAGEPVTFTVIDTAGISQFYDFEWQFGDQGEATGDTVEFSFIDDGRIEVVMNFMHKNGNCGGTVTKVLIIAPQPNSDFSTDVDSLDIICYPRQIEFNSAPNSAGTGLEYEWDFGDGQLSTIENPVFGFGRGDHEVTLKITNGIGCTDSTTINLTLVGPAADFEADKNTLCIDDEITITISNLENVTDFKIDLGDGSPLVENQLEVKHTYSEYPTIISLFATSDELGCDAIDTLSIDISTIEAFFEFECGGTAINNLSTAGAEYMWDFGDGITSNEENPEFPASQLSGATTIRLTAIDSAGICTSVFESTASNEPAFEMANLFSPNGDGNNDVFMPVNSQSIDDLRITTFKIYNRWGELVYDNEVSNGWSGFIDGEPAPPEVYAYYIVVQQPGCGENSLKGNVTLIR